MYESHANPLNNEMPNLEIGEDRSKVKRYRAIIDHLFSDLAQEAVILSLKNGRYYGVNQVGSAIWSIIQQPMTVPDIESFLMNEYDVDEETCSTEVASFLETMMREELVDVLDE